MHLHTLKNTITYACEHPLYTQVIHTSTHTEERGTVRNIPDSIQKVAILGSNFPISTVSPTVQRKFNSKSNRRWIVLYVYFELIFSFCLNYFELIFTIVSEELPPYFSGAPFILEHPWVEVWQVIIPENHKGYSARSAGKKIQIPRS